MLVNYVEPFGVICLEGHHIKGAHVKGRPADVSYEFYKRHEGSLVDGTYREDYLRKTFRGPFPVIAFKPDELRVLPRKTLEMLAHGMTVHVDDSMETGVIVKKIRARLREC